MANKKREDLINKIQNNLLERLKTDPYMLDGENMTQAVAKFKGEGTPKQIRDSLIEMIPQDGLELTNTGTSLYINTPDDWAECNPGVRQYYFQVF